MQLLPLAWCYIKGSTIGAQRERPRAVQCWQACAEWAKTAGNAAASQRCAPRQVPLDSGGRRAVDLKGRRVGGAQPKCGTRRGHKAEGQCLGEGARKRSPPAPRRPCAARSLARRRALRTLLPTSSKSIRSIAATSLGCTLPVSYAAAICTRWAHPCRICTRIERASGLDAPAPTRRGTDAQAVAVGAPPPLPPPPPTAAPAPPVRSREHCLAKRRRRAPHARHRSRLRLARQWGAREAEGRSAAARSVVLAAAALVPGNQPRRRGLLRLRPRRAAQAPAKGAASWSVSAAWTAAACGGR